MIRQEKCNATKEKDKVTLHLLSTLESCLLFCWSSMRAVKPFMSLHRTSWNNKATKSLHCLVDISAVDWLNIIYSKERTEHGKQCHTTLSKSVDYKNNTTVICQEVFVTSTHYMSHIFCTLSLPPKHLTETILPKLNRKPPKSHKKQYTTLFIQSIMGSIVTLNTLVLAHFFQYVP